MRKKVDGSFGCYVVNGIDKNSVKKAFGEITSMMLV